MFYFASKLYTLNEESFDINDWLELGQEIEELEPGIWKIWTTSEIYQGDDIQYRVFSVNGSWKQQETVAIRVANYLQVEKNAYEQGIMFTISSIDKNALESLVALLVNLYNPVEIANLEKFIEENESLYVQTAELVGPNGGQTIEIFSKPTTLRKAKSRNSHTGWILQSFTTIPIAVGTLLSHENGQLYISKTNNLIGLSLDNSSSEESENGNPINQEAEYIKSLFILINQIFTGISFSTR